MKTMTSGKGLALGLIAMLPLVAFGGDPPAQFSLKRPSIEGVWDSTVTLQVCASGISIRTFRALNSFEHHGSLVATSEVAQPPSLGKWRWLGGRKYRAQFELMRFGAGGVFEGMSRITRDITMAEDGNSFESVVSIRLFDISNTQFAEGCGKEAATRVF